MTTTLLTFLIPVVVLALLFLLVWRLDARRAERQAHDPERQDVTPDPTRGSRRRRGDN
ncbi:hypothetical protein [Nocardioides daphniae]|uniref:Preprotein translocase subunit TatA n=1 Tax=Nocardioides daphniae TaxID=402297 RepID=A0ABQ1QIC1_9ACTN|nr:hypothetical protein [Nocardioides daphniae]GGD26763.1 hypothetical protein GCM10007231_27750 [Nocardioides daphniae]